MDETPNLKLPYILPSQAQKHVTHNEALRLLDAVVNLSVKSRTLTAPPVTPSAGARYIVASPATGAWSGKNGMMASFIDDGWLFIQPATGWQAYIEGEAKLLVFDGAQWNPTGGGVPDTLSISMLGIQATADTVNRFAVSSAASLFNNAGAGHQIKLNKQAATDTASLLFQTSWTGYAEMGLNGSSNFSIKVSDDLGIWRQAMYVDRATGNVAIGANAPMTRLDVDGPIRPASFSKINLPQASNQGTGAMVYVTDASAGAQLAYSDGTSWRSVRTGVAIS
ncbi:MAG: DUF2793 domain-containing protein [Candidatus Ochrobactrum gambitense]|nr:MAG: DUF2793 domain-containing protein [Candidatus Ochrobactrum gambitense]WEK16961.1 MAG: DUF2793 domain-containing protein [Candidatus Ochrobactrum gambitense]